MKVSDFEFALPDRLIAQRPADVRSDSRLLHLDAVSGDISHYRFRDLPGLLSAGDLLVFNNTKVIPARLDARKATGGKVEILIERILANDQAMVQIKASKSPKPGTEIILDAGQTLKVLGRQGEFFLLEFPPPGPAAIAEKHGRTPLPPYIERPDEAVDQQRYQTVYAKQEGAVAAPTAGLHFDDAVFDGLATAGIAKCELTLHVGAGTFQPVRVQDVQQHQMHSEYLQLGANVCAAVQACRQADGRVIAVGTTSVRSLETASTSGQLKPYDGDTDIFIYPGYDFRTVDAMVTNFHLPASTLLMLVSAFAGREQIMRAYQIAIEESYRFFSYGDAMLITR